MSGTAHAQNDISVHGNATRMTGVKSPDAEFRPWIASFPVCPCLSHYNIAHVGIMEAAPPYQIVRTNQSSTYFMACYGGRGRVLIDGHWRECKAGMACLLPPHIYNAFYALPGERWRFCWVCYVQPAGQRPISGAASPVLARYDHVPLHSAIAALIHECQSGGPPPLIQKWVDLINDYVLRFARPPNGDARLRNLWERVASQLAEPWTLERLAREAGYSTEHLRRLCHMEVGRSPMHHIIYLRMRRAAELLAATNEKIEAIAQAVGYQNPFAFSKAFHKWIGWQPSAYRAANSNHSKRRGRAPHYSLLLVLLTSVCTGFSADDRTLPFGNPETESPAAVRAGAVRSAAGPVSSATSTEAAQLDRALRDEQLKAAKELCEAFPSDPDAKYVTGYVFHEQGDSASAVKHWEELVNSDEGTARLYGRADALYNLGYTYLLQENHQKAISYLRESVRLNPGRQEAHYRLAHALFLKGDLEESINVLDAAKIQAPLALRLRGMANQQLGKFDEAIRDYESALALKPDLAEAYYGLATVHARLGNKAKANECRKKFETLKAQADSAERQLRAEFDPLAITRRSVARTHTEIGRVYVLHGQTQKAEKLFLRAAEIDQQNTACRFQLVMLYQQAGKNEDALRFANEMVRAEPMNAFHYLAVGNLEARLGHHSRAEAAFRKVIELAPGHPEGYFALAQLCLQVPARAPEALQLARQAVQVVPSAVNYYVLSRALLSNGDVSGAIAAIEKACELEPNNPQFRTWRARLQQTR